MAKSDEDLVEEVLLSLRRSTICSSHHLYGQDAFLAFFLTLIGHLLFYLKTHKPILF